MRSASWNSASRSGRPKFCWSKVFLNSGPTGSVKLVGDHAHRGLKRMAGAKRAGQQVERLGKLLLELASCARDSPEHQDQRGRRAPARTPRSGRNGSRCSMMSATPARRAHAERQAHDDDRAGRGVHAGLLDQPRQADRPCCLRPSCRAPAAGPSAARLTRLSSLLGRRSASRRRAGAGPAAAALERCRQLDDASA